VKCTLGFLNSVPTYQWIVAPDMQSWESRPMSRLILTALPPFGESAVSGLAALETSLFGSFTIADAMYAPVVSRFITYGVTLDPVCQAYAGALWALPAMQDWLSAAVAEVEAIAHP